jgi:hypothetical protein
MIAEGLCINSENVGLPLIKFVEKFGDEEVL